MAEETEKQQKTEAAPAEESQKKLKKKKLRPTNCVQSNKRIRRKDWYYRNGKYFANKKAFKLYTAQEAEKAKKAVETDQASPPQAQTP